MAIIGTLPYILTNGTLANADEVMADFNAIVNQVNTNAQPTGSAITAGLEWTLLGGTPSYVTTTQFNMLGDQSAAFTIGRRIKTVNTSGLVYSTVLACFVSLNTTVTVYNDNGSPTLDSGLSAVSIGTLDSVDESIPVITDMSLGIGNSTSLPTASATVLFTGVASGQGDILGEWSGPQGKFIPRVSGTYIFTVAGYWSVIGATIANGAQFLLENTINGGGLQIMNWMNWPLATGVQGNVSQPIGGFITRPLTAGDEVQILALTPATVINTAYVGQMSIRRLRYT